MRLGVGGLFIWSRTLGWGCRARTQNPPCMRGLSKTRPNVRVTGKWAGFMGGAAQLCRMGQSRWSREVCLKRFTYREQVSR